jgi:hypothetical protein
LDTILIKYHLFSFTGLVLMEEDFGNFQDDFFEEKRKNTNNINDQVYVARVEEPLVLFYSPFHPSSPFLSSPSLPPLHCSLPLSFFHLLICEFSN